MCVRAVSTTSQVCHAVEVGEAAACSHYDDHQIYVIVMIMEMMMMVVMI